MVINFLRTNKFASIALALIRIYIGYLWLTAGWKKITGGFDTSGFLKGAIAKSTGENPAVASWWGTFLENVALPGADVFNILVPYGEFLVGLGLILGCLTKTAVFFGMTMNFAFLFSGTVSVNALMVLLSIFIIISGTNAGKFGLDGLLTPFLRKKGIDKSSYQKPKAA
jgi:thiosulfate dehydrogenase (quinone) large subunit